MRQGKTQFLYCCDQRFGQQYRAVMKSIKKSKGNLLTLDEEREILVTNTRYPKHRKCNYIHRCTMVYEIPT